MGNNRLSSRDNNSSVPLYLKAQPVLCRVSLAETLIVPARHEMLIPTKVSALDKKTLVNIGPGVVKPNLTFKRKPELALARSIVQPQGDHIAVRIVNISPQPITLYKNSKVANLHPLNEGEEVTTECMEPFEVLEPQAVKESNSAWGTTVALKGQCQAILNRFYTCESCVKLTNNDCKHKINR